jgi:hypothetical protein
MPSIFSDAGLSLSRKNVIPAPLGRYGTAGGWYRKATQVVSSLQILFPDRIKHEDTVFATRDEFKAWLEATRSVSLPLRLLMVFGKGSLLKCSCVVADFWAQGIGARVVALRDRQQPGLWTASPFTAPER